MLCAEKEIPPRFDRESGGVCCLEAVYLRKMGVASGDFDHMGLNRDKIRVCEVKLPLLRKGFDPFP
ncbi:hypothetical protein JOD24_002086 [Kroppenstedtia sanguinis]